jgi:hypothetical protein
VKKPQRELPLRVVSSKPKIRRRVFRAQLDPAVDGTYIFTAHSFSRRDRSYVCLVNPVSRHVHCTCPEFSRLRVRPTYLTGRLCKHLERAVRTVRRLSRHQQLQAA